MRSSPRASIGLSMLPASIGALGRAGPDHGVELVDEGDDLALGAADVVEHGLEPLLELAPELGPGDHGPQVEGDDPLVLERLGTSPSTIRPARPSTMAVLPTPGSPISTGLFLVRRDSTWTTRRTSSSRPITGSSLPWRAISVRSRPKRSSAWYLASGSWSVTFLPPRTSVRAARMASRVTPAPVSSLAAAVEPSVRASSRCSVETYWSPRAPASLRARSISRPSWGEAPSPARGRRPWGSGRGPRRPWP